MKYHSHIVFSFFSFPLLFMTANFAHVLRLNVEPILCGLLHMTSILGYCIPRRIKMQNVCVFPYFTPKQPKRGRNEAFSSQTRKIYKIFYYRNDWSNYNQILHSVKDHQILFVDRSKICHINPKWQRLPSWIRIHCYISTTVSTDFDEILNSDAYWPCGP